MKTIYPILLFMLTSFCIAAQEQIIVPRSSSEVKAESIEENEKSESVEIIEVRRFRELGGIGLGTISFRDFATSPLIYRGSALALRLGTTKVSSQKESKFGFDFTLGGTISSVNKESSLGIIINSDINYTQLYTIPALTFKGWQTKVGGTLSVLFVNRLNSDLRNNSIGFEFFPTLFGSFKIGKDFTRHIPLRKKKGPRKQHFSVRLDVGLINTNFRNGYAYTAHSPFYNGSDVFENHQFNVLSGFRIQSAIDYILYAKNTPNGFKVSYNWSGVLSGENPDRFAMSKGLVAFSFLYRIDK